MILSVLTALWPVSKSMGMDINNDSYDTVLSGKPSNQKDATLQDVRGIVNYFVKDSQEKIELMEKLENTFKEGSKDENPIIEVYRDYELSEKGKQILVGPKEIRSIILRSENGRYSLSFLPKVNVEWEVDMQKFQSLFPTAKIPRSLYQVVNTKTFKCNENLPNRVVLEGSLGYGMSGDFQQVYFHLLPF